MHSDSHPLESSFEPAAAPPELGDASAARDPVVEDFNSFFEKLSSLDRLRWRDAPAAGPETQAAPTVPVARGAKRRGAGTSAGQGSGRSPAGAARPRMTVLKSDHDLAAPPDPAAGAVARAEGRLTGRDVARFLRLVLIGLMLFALGLGAGWAALSLPGQFEQGVPTWAALLERARSAPPMQRDANGSSDALKLVPVGKASAPAADGANAAKGAIAANAANGAADVEETSAGQGLTSEAIELPLLREPGAAAKPARAVPAPVAAAASPAVAPAEPQFSLQVGACSSFDCVQKYRNLLLRRVSSGVIKVVLQPGAPQGGQAGPVIQRIRVEPLGRAEAERLKVDLAAMDKRFQDAYLIGLR